MTMHALLLLAVTCANPILHMDFSDPDVCAGADGRVYLTASSFGSLPGLPILVSDDLVNWSYVGHALAAHPYPSDGPEHGNSVWAPSIRYRADRGEYVIWWGDPDRGAYRVSAKSPAGPWSAPRLVVPAKGLIDVCPLYDDDGRVYLVNGWANSRAGLNAVLTVRELDADETCAVTEPVLVYDGLPDGNVTAEGPKFYKKDGEYWLWFPAGGVGGGWQVAARAKSPYGPYETKTVLAQGATAINGPHQGGVVNVRSEKGEVRSEKWWFVHFSDRDAYGRITYLEPMKWEKGAWPVVGRNGEPVVSLEVPMAREQRKFGGLAVSDEFDAPVLGPQWQFLGRSADLAAWSTAKGTFRLYSTARRGEKVDSLWETPNLMVQKFPASRFTATLKAQVGAKQAGDEAGLIVQGRSYARLGLGYRAREGMFDVVYATCSRADKGRPEREPKVLATLPARRIGGEGRWAFVADIRLRVEVAPASAKTDRGQLVPPPICAFFWSADGQTWNKVDESFEAVAGQWIGATFGLFAVRPAGTRDRGWIEADWLRVE